MVFCCNFLIIFCQDWIFLWAYLLLWIFFMDEVRCGILRSWRSVWYDWMIFWGFKWGLEYFFQFAWNFYSTDFLADFVKFSTEFSGGVFSSDIHEIFCGLFQTSIKLCQIFTNHHNNNKLTIYSNKLVSITTSTYPTIHIISYSTNFFKTSNNSIRMNAFTAYYVSHNK